MRTTFHPHGYVVSVSRFDAQNPVGGENSERVEPLTTRVVMLLIVRHRDLSTEGGSTPGRVEHLGAGTRSSTRDFSVELHPCVYTNVEIHNQPWSEKNMYTMFDITTCCSLCNANWRWARLVSREQRGQRQYTLVFLRFSPCDFEIKRRPDELLLR